MSATTAESPRHAHAIVLFAHGARDARWAEPFERLRDLVADQRPQIPVRLAFLELMRPDLAEAAGVLAADGCTALTIVPVFFGQGGHLRRDLPAQVDALRAALPMLSIDVAGAVGEDGGVLAAIAAYCIRAASAEAPGSGVG